jgi:predicted nucleotidyltransferase
MNILQSEHFDILKVLSECEVVFLLVGGAAVNYYGYSRTTGDIDVWINPDEQNKLRLIKALEMMELFEGDIEIIRAAKFDQPFVFHIGSIPPFIIDFMTAITGVKWEEAWQNRETFEMEGIPLNIIHINHLKVNKMLSGRPKDMEDLRQLARIEILKNRKK